MTPDVLDRFLGKFSAMDEEQGGCWQWHAALTTSGYGHMSVDSVLKPAHRLSYEHFMGPISEGLTLDHLCENKACVNPDHLEPVTHQENCRRAKARITHCPHGHAYDEANTFYSKGRAGRVRRCRTCTNAYVERTRDRERTRVRARYANDPEFAERLRAQARERYWRTRP